MILNKMKTHTLSKGKGGTRVSGQQANFELKQRVIFALNKLADRDTYQIGIEELEKTAQSLTSDGVAPFLSCVIDTDSGQKSTVRKECIRLMGTLVRFHEGLLSPHLPKMVASIVRRLKDPDSVVRDACVEVVGVLSSKMSNCEEENDGAFVVIVNPLFEALGEQNRHVQSGSASCLASVVDNAVNPPASVLVRMLTRITKFLKNPHFMAKPALIDLVRSIIQAGGAPTQAALSAAVKHIEEALKNNDWTTRKAASVALAGIAMSGGSSLQSIKASCVQSLESCRFDKVKPVRDLVMHALHCWKSIPRSDSCEPSEAGSSTKENYFGGDYSDLTNASDSGNAANCSVKKRVPLTASKACPNLVQRTQKSKTNDWHIEIAVPKSSTGSSAYTYAEAKDRCFSKTSEKTLANGTVEQDTEYDYVSGDEKPECSSVSNLVTSSNFETKCVSDAYDCFENSGLTSPMAMHHHSEAEEVFSEHIISERLRERQSMDSTVTEASPEGRQECCSQTRNEISSIRKHLLEIETKQSNLMDLLQVFMGSTMSSFTSLESKVLGLEHAIEKISQNLVQPNTRSNMANSKLSKPNQSVASPRYSICTPRPSLDISNTQLSSIPKHNRSSRSTTFGSHDLETRRDSRLNISSSSTIKQSLGHQPQNRSSQTRDSGRVSVTSAKNSLWKRVKEFVCAGDLDSAYVEVLCSGDDIALIELLDRTGPVLERLSGETVAEILSTLAVFILDQRYLGSIIPWLQQVVDLSSAYGPDYLELSPKARMEFVSAIQEAASMNYSNPSDRRSVTKLAVKLRQVWG